MSQMNNLNGTGAMPVGRANHGTDGSPLPQDEKVLESTQFKKYKNWMYAAATIANSCEGYAIFMSVALTFLYPYMFMGGKGVDIHELPVGQSILLKVSIFIGIILGLITSQLLVRIFDDRQTSCAFLIIMLIANLGVTLANPGGSISFLAVLVWWRILLGFGIGGIRAINALPILRTTSTRWRGGRAAYTALFFYYGYLILAIVAFTSLDLTHRFMKGGPQDKPGECGAQCRLRMDRIWRLTSGLLCPSILMALIARYWATRIAPHPYNTQTPFKFSPSFCQFWSALRMNRSYRFPLAYISIITFFSSMIFYGMLLGSTGMMFHADKVDGSSPYNEYGEKTPSDLLHHIFKDWLILTAGGVLSGGVILTFLADIWGRKRMLLISYVFLFPIFTVLATVWPRMSTTLRIVLLALSLVFLAMGPMGVSCIYSLEIFPRMYRSWCFTAVNIFGCLGAIAGIIAAEYMLTLGTRAGMDGVQIACSVWAGCLLPGFVCAFGLVETTRKEIGIIEGEVYGDWEKWNGPGRNGLGASGFNTNTSNVPVRPGGASERTGSGNSGGRVPAV